MTLRAPAAWIRVALAMFAVGWGANQFSPMLIVYRQALGLGAAEIAGLFGIYAATLIPGLLAGGPLSDRFGRRACVLPFAALSPVATLLLILGPHDLALIAAGRALAGVCSGMVFGPATAWVQDLSGGSALSARRAALALSAGFGFGPIVAAALAQWAPHPLVVPYLPHLVLGVVALAAVWTVPDVRRAATPALAGPAARRWAPPAALRTRAFWLTVAPAAPFVFGSMSMAIVVLPEEVTSASTLSAAFAGLMTALAFAAGIGVQTAARVLAERSDRLGILAGTGAAAAGAAVSAVAVAGPDRVLAGLGAVLLGLAYGLCLVCGLHQAEQLSDATDRGALLSCYYVLAYLGFSAPYAMDGLNEVFGKPGTFAVLAVAAAVLTGLLAVGAARGRPAVTGEPQAAHTWDHARS
ncbi:MAG TPA: MFS transporter [Trebonia sp.]|nr:MFS transporter [Trebonia sp.]